MTRNRKILLAFFLVNLALNFFIAINAKCIETDGCGYAWLAMDIKAGNISQLPASIYPPFYPAMTAVFSFIFKNTEFAGRMVSALLGALTVFPLYWFTKQVFNKKVAVITLIFYTLHPYLTQVSAMVATEALYIFLITSIAAITCYSLENRRENHFWIIGVLLIITFLTRFEEIFSILLVLFLIWSKKYPENQTKFKLKSTFNLTITFTVLFVCYLALTAVAYSNLQLNPRLLEHLQRFYRSDFRPPLTQMVAFMIHQLKNNLPLIPLELTKAVYPVFLPLVIYGIIKRKYYTKYHLAQTIVLSLIIYRIAVLTISVGIIKRYFFMFTPLLLSWAAVGFEEINYRLNLKYPKFKMNIFGQAYSKFAVIFIIIVAVICLPRGFQVLGAKVEIQKQAGLWLKKINPDSNFKIIAGKPREAYYAGAQYQYLTPGSYLQIIKQIKKSRPDYVIINSHIAGRLYPDFLDKVSPDDLILFCDKFQNYNSKIYIYKLPKKTK